MDCILRQANKNMKEVIIPSNIVALQKEISPQDLGIITNSHLLQENRNFWLGTVVVPANASRYYLEMAEALIIYFWQPSLNEKKKNFSA